MFVVIEMDRDVGDFIKAYGPFETKQAALNWINAQGDWPYSTHRIEKLEK